MKIVMVKWRDSRMYIQQTGIDEKFECCEIKSVGFVIEEDSDKLVIAGDLVDDCIRRTIVIPVENIISSKILAK